MYNQAKIQELINFVSSNQSITDKFVFTNKLIDMDYAKIFLQRLIEA